MTAAAAPRLHMTAEEYLVWEEAQEEKHEWYDGEVFAMADGTAPHARIISNLYFRLRQALEGGPCPVFTDALRVRNEAVGLYTYPDLSIVCGEPAFADPRQTSLVNPTVLVEVLSLREPSVSPSTERYDRTTKRGFYGATPSLQAYVLVAQHPPGLDALVRDGERWTPLREDEAGRVAIPPLGVELDLAEVYEGVTFPEPDEDARPTAGLNAQGTHAAARSCSAYCSS